MYDFADLSLNVNPENIDVEKLGMLKLVNQRLEDRISPQSVLDATDRRTTNPKERKSLFNYLKKIVTDGEVS
jgi:hypothetical protein